MSRDFYTSPTEFRSFANQVDPLASGLAGQIATRLAAGEMTGLFGVLPNPDPVLRAMGQQVKVYKNLLSDPLVMGARRRRIAAVLSMKHGLRHDGSTTVQSRVVDSCEGMLARLDIQRIVREWMDGAFFGYRISEVMWEQNGSQVQPVDVRAKPNEWFGFEEEHGDLYFKPSSSSKGVKVPPNKFIVVGRMRSWENPYGEPDLAACFWPVTFKRAGLKFWVTFTEKYGMPWAVGKLPRAATEKEMDDLADKLAAMVHDAVAVVPNDSSVELISPKGSNKADLYEKFLMFCRSEISIALLGNNQSVELQANNASAQAAQSVEAYLRNDDALMVAAGFNQLIRMFCEINFPSATPPTYHFWDKKKIDQIRAARDEKLAGAGAKFTKQYWQRTYGFHDDDLA